VAPDPVSGPANAAPQLADAAASLKMAGEQATALLAEAKRTLEYQLAGRKATVRLAGKLLTLKKWGLSHRLRLVPKVGGILNRLTLAGVTKASLVNNEEMLAAVSGSIIEEVMQIIAASLDDPFKSVAEAYDFLDTECGLEDIIDLAFLVYDQNLSDQEVLNTRQLERSAKKLQSLLR
jgi:hypothetical protein